MKVKQTFKTSTFVLLAVALLLLAGSAVGSARAALTYYSENFVAGINTSKIGVSLVENGTATDVLLTDLLGEDEELILGKKYDEAISVTNTGSIDSYVRVIVKKSWQDEKGKKDTTLSPKLIDLHFVTGNGWVIDESATTDERTVLYYTGILPVGASTPALTDTLRIDPIIGTKVVETVEEVDGGQRITYVYEYDGYYAHIDAEVDAVQTHNAQDAIKSAWGIDVNVGADGSLSLR